MAPLSTGAAGIQSAEVTVFGFWTDVDLAVPVVPQMSKKI